MTTNICIGCKAQVDTLETFPGPRCLTCWEPIGNAEVDTMTAEDISGMWRNVLRKQDR